MAAGNLPAGASPVCSDMFFGGQYTATRPALVHAFADPLVEDADILSHNDYPLPNGQSQTVVLYSDGSVWCENVQTTTATQVGAVTPGARFKSIAAFDKFFMAFRPPVGGALPNLSGCDIPSYINANGKLRPVTQDAPGGGFSVTGVTIGPEDLVTPGAWITGPDITSVTLGGQQTITVNVPNKGSVQITEYTTATITLASAVTLAAGQVVQLFGITWGLAGGPQWANGIPVATPVTSSTTFTINISGVTQNNSASGGTFAVQASAALSLTRQNNIVTAYLEDTSPASPTEIQQGWFVSIIDTQATSTAELPDGTVPFTSNELFQAIFPSSSGSGGPIGLLTGTTVFINGWPENTPTYPVPEPSGTYTWTYPGDGGNNPYEPSVYNNQPNASTYQLTDEQSLLFNMQSSSFIPDFDFSNENTQNMKIPNIHPDGSYAGSSTAIPSGQYFHGEGNNFDLSAFGSFTVSVAGNVTFQMSRSDGVLLGIKGATYVSGPQSTDITSTPQTVTAIKGYPLTYYNNTTGNGGTVDTFVVNFPAPGVYEFELDMRHWKDSIGWFDLVYRVSGVNHVIMPTTGPGSANVKGDGVGNIHVTLPIAVEALPIGSWLYLTLNTPAPANVVNWTISSNGSALIQLTANSGVNFSVGEEVLLNGFQGSGQPTGWNGQTVTITAVDTSDNTYQFAWSGPASGGSSTTGTATPVSQQYPSGWVQVTQVISPTEFVYFAIGNTQTLQSTGVVYDYFGSLNTQQSLNPATQQLTAGVVTQSTQSSASGIVQGFQVLSVDTTTTPNSITWYQAGFNDSYTGTHVLQVQPQSQIAGGPRNLLMFNINEDGGASPASYPIYVQLNGGTEFANITLPLGPPGTTARAIAWTPAYGAYYYTLAPGNIPAAAGNAPIISLGTIIYDNFTTNTIMDFSDVALLNGTIVGPVTPENSAALSDDFGDLTSTIVLPPCAGVIEYNEQMAFWGELNCLPNHSMINMGFDGNYTPNTTYPAGAFGADFWGTTWFSIIPKNFKDSLPTPWAFAINITSLETGGSGPVPAQFDGIKIARTLANQTAIIDWTTVTFGGTTSPTFAAIGQQISDVINLQLDDEHDYYVAMYAPGISGNDFGIACYGGSLPNCGNPNGNQLSASSIPTLSGTVRVGLQPIMLWIPSVIGAAPNGWDNTTVYDGVTPDQKGSLTISTDETGFAYQLDGTTGTLNFVIYSPTLGVLAEASFPMTGFTSTTAWYSADFSDSMPSSIPVDTVFFLYVSGGSGNSMISQSFYQDYYGTPIGLPNRSYIMRFQATVVSSNTLIDNLEVIDAQQPVLNNQIRLSYEDNEFGYDNQNGFVVGLDTTDFIAGMFLQRQYLYALTDGIGEQHTILANNSLPNQWDVSIHAKECACAGPDAVTSARATSWWMGRHGVQIFNGDQPKKISQAVAQDFEQTNWDAASNSCMAADTVQRVVYMAFPTGANTDPNFSYSMNTRLADNEYNIADPVHVSSYTGRIISTDLGEKWCPMTVPVNSMCMSTQSTPNGYAKVMTFGGGSPDGTTHYGQLYLQDYWNYPPVTPSADSWNCLDADYGVINWEYMTYFFVSHDVEKQAQDALYRKLFGYMAVHVSGVGMLQITPYVASLVNPWPALAPFPLTLADPGADYNLGLNVLGERMSLKFTGVPAEEGQGTAMLLTHLIISLREDNVFPVSGLW